MKLYYMCNIMCVTLKVVIYAEARSLEIERFGHTVHIYHIPQRVWAQR